MHFARTLSCRPCTMLQVHRMVAIRGATQLSSGHSNKTMAQAFNMKFIDSKVFSMTLLPIK